MRWFELLIRTLGDVSGTGRRPEADPAHTGEICQLDWECLHLPPEKLEEVGDGGLGIPPTTEISGRKWMDGNV